MNKAFKKPPKKMGEESSFRKNTARCWGDNNEPEDGAILPWTEVMEECESKAVDVTTLVHKATRNSVNADASKYVRMQEIEDYILENNIVRKIEGNLCIWTGKYYKAVTATTYAKEIRGSLPRDMQNKLPRYSILKESYEYMNANSRIEESFSDEIVERTKHMLVFENGIYDSLTGKFIGHSSEYPVLFMVHASYDEKEGDSETLNRMLDVAFNGEKQIKKLFFEVLGYILAQGNSLKKFFVFGTAPDSGKSIIGELIGKLLGEENTSTLTLHELNRQFALGNIAQKVLNYNMDLPMDPIDSRSVQKIKLLTGDPRIESEMKHVQGKTVYHHCKFLFATNHPVLLKRYDEPFFSRLLLIPFLQGVSEEEKDYELLSKLWDERNAIVTKAAKAYKKLCKRNFRFTKCEIAERMLEAWSNSPRDYMVRKFVESECICCEDGDAFTPTEELFNAYRNYCNLHRVAISNDKKIYFSKKFHEETGLEPGRRRVEGYASPVNGYIGVSLQ